jgi:hypothetical protein
MPSTSKIIADCRKIQKTAGTIKEQTSIPDVPDLAILIGALAARVEGLAEELNSVSLQAGNALGMIDEHVECEHS